MNILFLSTWFPYPPDNGSKIRACYLIGALAKKHEVSVVAFCPRPDEAKGSGQETGVTVYPVEEDPFRYVSLPPLVKFASPIPLACWPSRMMTRKVKELAGAAPWDAVVCFESPVARYAALVDAPRLLEVDTSLTYQMCERYRNHTGGLGRWRAWASWRKAYHWEKRLFQRFRACTVVSPKEAPAIEEMVRGSGCRVAVVPNGVDCERNRPNSYPRRPNTLVYNGALTYSANYDAMHYFLEVIFPLIKGQLPDASLTITGSTQGVELAGLRLDDGVHLSGYVADIRPVVGGASACVVPLRQGGGTRIKILEAMALGTPVISTTKGAEGLEVVHGEHLLIADDPASFAGATLRLLRDEALRQRLAANARRLVEARYDWAAIGARFVGLVEEVVGCPPTRRQGMTARER